MNDPEYQPQTRKTFILRAQAQGEPHHQEYRQTLTNGDIAALKNPVLKVFARLAFHPGDKITCRLHSQPYWEAELIELEIED